VARPEYGSLPFKDRHDSTGLVAITRLCNDEVELSEHAATCYFEVYAQPRVVGHCSIELAALPQAARVEKN
jgi:hypothetical protein